MKRFKEIDTVRDLSEISRGEGGGNGGRVTNC